jgi:hypothetical protein
MIVRDMGAQRESSSSDRLALRRSRTIVRLDSILKTEGEVFTSFRLDKLAGFIMIA